MSTWGHLPGVMALELLPLVLAYFNQETPKCHTWHSLILVERKPSWELAEFRVSVCSAVKAELHWDLA